MAIQVLWGLPWLFDELAVIVLLNVHVVSVNASLVENNNYNQKKIKIDQLSHEALSTVDEIV